MEFQPGDVVRVLVSPEVDEQLWDELGVVAALDREGRIVVELGDGADCTLLPGHLDLVEAREFGPPLLFSGGVLRPE